MLPRSRASKSRSSSRTLADDIYNRIRLEILSLKIKPGQRLEEEELAASYGVSRTPVREALQKLERDGLIVLVPRRSAYVSEISLREALEIDQLRELLEPFAALQAAGRIPPDKLHDLLRQLENLESVAPGQEDYVKYLHLDVQLHECILEYAGNSTMKDVVTRLHHRMNAIRVVSTAPRYRESIEEHKRIINALLAGNGEEASRAMREHIQNARLGRMGVFGLEG